MRNQGEAVSPAGSKASADLTPDFTFDELLKALEGSWDESGDGVAQALTSEDICEKTGWGHHRVLRKLKSLKRAGCLEVVVLRRENLDGKMGVRPGYRLKKADTGVRAV